MQRGYQADFYTLSEGVRDPTIRQRKAAKIHWALTTFAADVLPGAICLDVGCSAGLMTATLAPLFAQTLGLDYDTVALGKIDPVDRPLVGFLRGDAMCLPLPDRCVDVVLCAQVYEHVPDDTRLFAEIERVLRPGGVAFFSGPNWLFPIEPHYFIPFLHWLPAQYADALLRMTGQGDHYYEKSRPVWQLRHLFRNFIIEDISLALLRTPFATTSPTVRWLGQHTPQFVWQLLHPLLPNYNWLLRKP